MPSSYTPNGALELQATGENLNIWGNKLDNTVSRIADLICGYLPLTITGDYTLSATLDNTTADESRMAHLKLGGSPAANFKVILPGRAKNYWIWNATAKVATITTNAGTTVNIDAGDKTPVWCDGANVNDGLYFGGLRLKDYIQAFSASAGAVPSPLGNAGKFLWNDGNNVLWKQPATTDLSDYARNILGVQVALATAL
jgi:hypothetical protein